MHIFDAEMFLDKPTNIRKKNANAPGISRNITRYNDGIKLRGKKIKI